MALFFSLLVSVNLCAGLIEDGIDESRKGNHAEALKLFHKSCDSDNAMGCYYTAQAYNMGRVTKQDLSKALTYFTKSCDLDYIDSCMTVARSYYKGEGLEQDYFKANELFIRACDGAIAKACQTSGLIYELGKGSVKEDRTKAKHQYKKACDLGVEDGCKFYKDMVYLGH